MDDGFHEKPVIFLSYAATHPKKEVREKKTESLRIQKNGRQRHSNTTIENNNVPIGRGESKAAVASTHAMKAKRLRTAATSQLELV